MERNINAIIVIVNASVTHCAVNLNFYNFAFTYVADCFHFFAHLYFVQFLCAFLNNTCTLYDGIISENGQ